MGSLDGHSLTREGCTTVWVYPNHSATSNAPLASVEEMDARWMQFSDYIAHVGQICIVPDQCSSNYMEWFYIILHPFMTSAQPWDLPRVLSVQQYDTFVEPDVHQQPVATMALDEADVNVHHPRHTDSYVVITDKLKRLLNLRILTE
ncbi:hypothetical protein HKD37_03G007760 [Glycine soja]